MINHHYIDYFLNGTYPGESAYKRPQKPAQTDDHPKPEPMPTKPEKTPEKPAHNEESFRDKERRYTQTWREKNRDKYNEYMREYRRKKRHQ